MVPQVLGDLVGVERGVVADDAAVDLQLRHSVPVLLHLGVEEGGRGRGCSGGVAYGHVVDGGVLVREVLAEESGLLAVVVVGDDEDLVGKHVFEAVLPQQRLHDVVQLVARVERVVDLVDEGGQLDSEDEAHEDEGGEDDPELGLVLLVLKHGQLEALVHDLHVLQRLLVHQLVQVAVPESLLQVRLGLQAHQLSVLVEQRGLQLVLEGAHVAGGGLVGESELGVLLFLALQLPLRILDLSSRVLEGILHLFVVVQVGAEQPA
mmetsp:Transcript_4126/g.6983  ORF Transcript_4126/g.6983 Transcript_4126/m.6983 type:complete len:263 (+) Transcript_4126:406-1194(+)